MSIKKFGLPRVLFNAAGPRDFVAKYANGKQVSSGFGKSFVMFPRTTIAMVPTDMRRVPFYYTERTSDQQSLIIQGELEVTLDAEKVLMLYDFSVDVDGIYRNDGLQAVDNAVRAILRTSVRSWVNSQNLEDALNAAADLQEALDSFVRDKAQNFSDIGIAVRSVIVQEVDAENRDLKQAMEATAREQLFAQSDAAIAQRRQKAAESDRQIKKYEAETAKELEKDRADLLEVRNDNLIAEAEADAEAQRKRLEAYENVGNAPIMMALQTLANSGIEQLSVTPDLVAAFRGMFQGGE